ncbi:MAG: hypothetical protein Q8M98_01730 [Candidatus Cloacimonadaceae bacterium]|nr:hypothetical protein [Candidatus Cloacimonadaceae bacterium]MDP3113473.1 hypothetical protein [Candidatus Cloacimonadaceae bacterium]
MLSFKRDTRDEYHAGRAHSLCRTNSRQFMQNQNLLMRVSSVFTSFIPVGVFCQKIGGTSE